MQFVTNSVLIRWTIITTTASNGNDETEQSRFSFIKEIEAFIKYVLEDKAFIFVLIWRKIGCRGLWFKLNCHFVTFLSTHYQTPSFAKMKIQRFSVLQCHIFMRSSFFNTVCFMFSVSLPWKLPLILFIFLVAVKIPVSKSDYLSRFCVSETRPVHWKCIENVNSLRKIICRNTQIRISHDQLCRESSYI